MEKNNIVTLDFTEIYSLYNQEINEPFNGSMKPKKGSILKRFMNLFKK